MSCSRSDHKMIEYLNPSQLFLESMTRDYYNPVFLAFSFRDGHASVAIAKDFLRFAHPHSKLPRDETLFDRLLNIIHSVQNDPVEEYELLGIVVGYINPVDNIHNLMANLCKRGNFESLKYTCWKDDIASKTFLEFFGSLYMDEFEEIEETEDEFEEREDEDDEREDK
ncbi:hypothetical protein LWI29_031607 [Acer saccharum]|uniref:Uncharacterized protein n=1 Tax=Acer saccharum TaxID=4024 RepID=A0AA39SXJ0_ACESA|nr:hypothetical protein LWI29_031607 [Acer saccharum]